MTQVSEPRNSPPSEEKRKRERRYERIHNRLTFSSSRSPDRKRSRHSDDGRRGSKDNRDRRDRDYDRRDRRYDDRRDRRDYDRRDDRDRRERDRRDDRDRRDRDRDDRRYDREIDRDRRHRGGERRERERDRDDAKEDAKRKAGKPSFCNSLTLLVEALVSEDVGDRDARTVFVTNLPLKANAQDIKEFFERAGKVRDVRLITDRFSKKSKGYIPPPSFSFTLLSSSVYSQSSCPRLGKLAWNNLVATQLS